MTSNLKIKILVIVVVILACIYGIIGLPTSTQQLVDNWHNNIHLGLDLKGGSQLVLQVQIQDAFKAEADTVIQRLKDQLGAKGIAYADMSRNDPPTIQAADTIAIDIKGVPATSAGVMMKHTGLIVMALVTMIHQSPMKASMDLPSGTGGLPLERAFT